MKLELGKTYKARNGNKVFVQRKSTNPSFDFFCNVYRKNFEASVDLYYKEDGSCPGLHEDSNIVSEWEEPQASPIRTITKKELVWGFYGRFHVTEPNHAGNEILLQFLYRDPKTNTQTFGDTAGFNSKELRDAAKLFNELADYLDEQERVI